MIAVTYINSVVILDATTLEPLNEIENLSRQFTRAVWSPNGIWLVLDNYPTIEIWQNAWDAVNAQPFYTLTFDRLSGVTEFAWNADSTRLAVAIGEVVKIWDITSPNFERSITGEWSQIFGILWHPDELLNIATMGPYVFNFDLETGAELNYFAAGAVYDAVTDIALNPASTAIVMCARDGVLLIWDNLASNEFRNDGASLRLAPDTFIENRSNCTSVAWNATGDLIAASYWNGEIWLWDAHSGEILQSYKLEETTIIESVVFSPDGTRLAFGQADGSIAIVDVTQFIPSTCNTAGTTTQSIENCADNFATNDND